MKAHGVTDQSEYFMIVEDVGGTNPGEPKTGLVAADFTSARYVRDRGLPQTITLSDLAAADSAHSDGGIKEVDATNCKGLYRVDMPDAAYASGADAFRAYLTVAAASNAIAQPLEVILTPYTAAKAAFLDAAITSRPDGSDYTAARAAKLDNADIATSSRASPDQAGGILTTTVSSVSGAPPVNVVLTAGPALDDALNDCWVLFRDVSVAGDFSIRKITDYTGSTKTAVIDNETSFTLVAGDTVEVFARQSVQGEATTALTGIRLHQILNATAGGVKPAVGSMFDQAFNKDGSQTFDPSTDSLEAAADAGVAALIAVTPIIPFSLDLANTAAVRIGLKIDDRIGDLPTAAEITPGTYSIERKAYGGTTWSAVVTDAACSEQDGFVYFDEVFDTATGYAENDSVRFTFKSQSVLINGQTFELNDATGVRYQTSIRPAIAAGTTDFTVTERNQIRHRLGLDGTTEAPAATPSLATAAAVAAVQADTDDLQTRIPAALVGGRMDSSVGSVAAGAIGSASFAAGAINAAAIGTGAIDADAIAAGAITTAAFAVGAIDVNAVADNFITAAKLAADAIGSSELSIAAANRIADCIIRRTYGNARASADGDAVSARSLLGAISLLVNKVAKNGAGTRIESYHEDDLSVAVSRAFTSDAAANPITSFTP